MSRTKHALILMGERVPEAVRSEWEEMLCMATTLVESGFLPKSIRTPQQCVAVIMKGRELGVPMMQALTHIHIIEGKPSLSAELMLSLIIQHKGAYIEFVQNDSEACVIRIADRATVKGGLISFSKRDAETAQLLGKDNWKKYLRAMLRSRAIAEMARTYFADVISGVSYTPEELAGDRVVMNGEGEVIEIRPVDKPVGKNIIAPVNDIPAKVLEFRDPGQKVMPDEPRAWEWLNGRMSALDSAAKEVIRLGAVGRKVCELIADIEAARIASLLVVQEVGPEPIEAQG